MKEKEKIVSKGNLFNSFKQGVFFGLGALFCGGLVYSIGITVDSYEYTQGQVLSAESFNKITKTLKDVYNEIGSIGIGTDDPQDRLDVNGKIRMRQETVATDDRGIVATKGYVDDMGGGSSIPTNAKWKPLAYVEAQTYTWTNAYTYPVHVSVTTGQAPGSGANSCALSIEIDGVSMYHSANNNIVFAKACGGYTVVMPGSTMRIVSVPYWGSPYINAHHLVE